MTKDKYFGREINNEYILKERIGVGSTGATYRAFRKSTNEDVAVKLMFEFSIDYDKDNEISKTIENEVEILGKLDDHPNIVKFRDWGIYHADRRIPYLVTEFKNGGNLRTYFNLHPHGLKMEEFLPMLLQLAAGLDHLHRKEIYHLDLKPENIVLHSIPNHDLQLCIVDFHIAKMAEQIDLISESRFRGSSYRKAGYLAPDIWDKDVPTTHKVDIYSLGVIAYEALEGRLPFSGSTMWESMHEKIPHIPLYPSRTKEELNCTLCCDIILRAFHKLPQYRHYSAGEFHRELQKAYLSRWTDFEQEIININNKSKQPPLEGQPSVLETEEDLQEIIEEIPTPPRHPRNRLPIIIALLLVIMMFSGAIIYSFFPEIDGSAFSTGTNTTVPPSITSATTLIGHVPTTDTPSLTTTPPPTNADSPTLTPTVTSTVSEIWITHYYLTQTAAVTPTSTRRPITSTPTVTLTATNTPRTPSPTRPTPTPTTPRPTTVTNTPTTTPTHTNTPTVTNTTLPPPETDTDGDQVPDSVDACPTQPAIPGEGGYGVGPNGCPSRAECRRVTDDLVNQAVATFESPENQAECQRLSQERGVDVCQQIIDIGNEMYNGVCQQRCTDRVAACTPGEYEAEVRSRLNIN